MDKNNTLFPDLQDEKVISFSKTVKGKKIKVDFDAPDLSSNGGLLFASGINCGFIDKISDCIPDCRNPFFIQHTIRDMVRQRVGQIACGYEDANDCNALRSDSALKMMAGRLPSDNDLCSQPTMTRLENHVGIRALYQMGQLFVKEFVRSFTKAPKRIILDVDDTNANTYGNQQLSLFNDYYGESCYMPTLMYDGLTGKMILPILRPGRRNKSVNIFGILRRVVEYLHQCWPRTIIELRGDSHFCSHEFMDWIKDAKHCYVRSIARFMNLSSWVDWGSKMLDCHENLTEKMKDAYSFIPKNKELLEELFRAVDAVRYVEKRCKNKGLSIDTCRKCQKYILHNVIGDANSRRAMLGIEMLEYFKQEESLLLDNKQKDNISSDIIESDFGIYKSKKSPNKLYGITPFVLLIPLYPKLVNESVTKTFNFKERLVNVKLKDIETFAKDNMSKNWVTERTKTLKKTG